MRSPFVFITSVLLSFATTAVSFAEGTGPTPVSTASPELTSPTPTPTVDNSLKPEEKKNLVSKFRKTISEQEKNLDRDQKTALRDFMNAESQHLKDWRNSEKKERQIYFDQHLSGPDRRAYVQSYIGRKMEFDQKQKDDLLVFKNSQIEKHDFFKAHQKDRQTQFQSAIDKNVRPPESVWSP